MGADTDGKMWLTLGAVVSSCLLWFFFSTSAILVNKHILVDLKFAYPVSIAWLGLLTSTVASAVLVPFVIPASQRVHLTRRAFIVKVMPTGFAMALTFQLGNLSYLYLSVAFIQMLKAVCPVITMLLLFAFKLEKPTPQLITTVVIISAGVAIASWGELNMSLFGLAAMLTSVTAESARLVLTQYLVCTSYQLHPLEGLMYIGGASTFWLTLQAAVWELAPIVSTQAYTKVAQYPLHFLMAAFAGFGTNLLAILVIKLSSSLTLKVLGTFKDVALVTAGMFYMHEQVSQLQLWGYACSVMGFALYNWLKFRPSSLDPRRSLLPIIGPGKSA